MLNHHNIEKSGFRRGVYVGYAAGIVYRITRNGAGWLASNPLAHRPTIYGDTLRALSLSLECEADNETARKLAAHIAETGAYEVAP